MFGITLLQEKPSVELRRLPNRSTKQGVSGTDILTHIGGADHGRNHVLQWGNEYRGLLDGIRVHGRIDPVKASYRGGIGDTRHLLKRMKEFQDNQ